jgi:Uma2 family endonuclease
VSVPKPLRMTADEFLAWALEQPAGRYELAAGEVIAMAPERAGHALVKLAIARALGDAVAAAGLDCDVFPDGMAIRINGATIYEPDASLRCGPSLAENALEVPDPLVVVEVLSPSSRAQDSGAKLEAYFRLDSVRHYLIVNTATRAVIHHARDADGTIETRIHAGGELRLDPPGLVLRPAEFFARLGSGPTLGARTQPHEEPDGA